MSDTGDSGRRIGILGGTFDPPHLGHLLIAETARVALDLESVLFVPAGEPWLKSGQRITPASHRLHMVRIAVADNPRFCVSDCEIRRTGATYTVDTLRELRRAYPDDTELFFIVGSDVLDHFHRWKEPDEILALCRLAVIERPGGPADGIEVLSSASRTPWHPAQLCPSLALASTSAPRNCAVSWPPANPCATRSPMPSRNTSNTTNCTCIESNWR